MELLLHTIALEPARWTSNRVSQDLIGHLPAIARTRFKQLEIFEPHIAAAPSEALLLEALKTHGLDPAVLSSYIDPSPATSDEDFSNLSQSLIRRIHYFGFRKVRIFPGPRVKPTDERAISTVANRIREIAGQMPGVEVLLETHDGSIADSPERIIQLVTDIGMPNVGLVWQPTVFEPDAARRQLEIQRPFVRHIHLQNRNPQMQFVSLASGVIPVRQICLDLQVDASVEFVPGGICPVETFDFSRSLAEAVSEADYIMPV